MELSPVKKDSTTKQDPASCEPVSDAARRALAEAEERRSGIDAASNPAVREINGRMGPEPVRYGDWENKGIAVDF